MFSRFLLLLTLINSVVFSQNASKTEMLILMGSRFEITAIADDSLKAQIGIDSAIAEIRRIENIISSHIENSETSLINKNAGIKAIKVQQELFNLIQRSIKISNLTNGIFDISWASMNKIWIFNDSIKTLPDEDKIKQSVAKINYKNIILDKENMTVFLKEKGMKIGFGAIGKGFAANKARDKMKKLGIANGIVIAGGDLITWGKQKDGNNWKIGIANPDKKNEAFSWLEVSEMAVVTSGNYEKFIEINGKKYSHIINPKTGYPAKGIKSVTVVCPNAELADALATSVFIIGEKSGLNLINQLKSVECLIVTDENKKISSNNLNLNYYQANDKKHNYNYTIE